MLQFKQGPYLERELSYAIHYSYDDKNIKNGQIYVTPRTIVGITSGRLREVFVIWGRFQIEKIEKATNAYDIS